MKIYPKLGNIPQDSIIEQFLNTSQNVDFSE